MSSSPVVPQGGSDYILPAIDQMCRCVLANNWMRWDFVKKGKHAFDHTLVLGVTFI